MWGGGLFMAVAAVACGGGLEGVYEPESRPGAQASLQPFERLEFRSGSRVELTIMGSIIEGSFEVEGDRVRIIIAGNTQIFRREEGGCLEGGDLMGRYCPAGRDAERDGSKGKRPSGTYVARGDPDESVALAFGSSGELRVTITEGDSTHPAVEGSYSMRGDQIQISIPVLFDGSFELTYRGDVLEGVVQGDSVRFTRR